MRFQFVDYAKLTVTGVVITSLGWPVVVRLSSDPRWVYRWLAVLVTGLVAAGAIAAGRQRRGPLVWVWLGALCLLLVALAVWRYRSVMLPIG